jgi:putative Mg2+ transporter-C (MgtC) family protein
VAAGVGFIGAGAIIRHGDSVSGVTTAATVWLAAAVGMMAAAGGYVAAVTATAIALIAIVLLGWAKPQLRRLQRGRTIVDVQYQRGHGTIGPVLRFLADHGADLERLDVQDDRPDPDEPGLRSVRLVVTLNGRDTLEGSLAVLGERPEVRAVEVAGRHCAKAYTNPSSAQSKRAVSVTRPVGR